MGNEQNGRLSETASHILDPWSGLQRFTPARIALGRAGGSLPTGELLDFRLAHARAVDAVHQPFEADALKARLAALGLPTITLTTAVPGHTTFLQRPDLGRVLSDESRRILQQLAGGSPRCDLVIIISDGLSALAVERQ